MDDKLLAQLRGIKTLLLLGLLCLVTLVGMNVYYITVGIADRKEARLGHTFSEQVETLNGEQQWDDSFLIWLNAEAGEIAVTMPENHWVTSGEVVVSTCPDHPAGTPVEGGDTLTLGGRTVVVLRELRQD